MTQKEQHMKALNNFAERVKKDPNVVALMVYGSLAYGDVWKRSDIDVELIVRDGAVYNEKSFYTLIEDGVEINMSSFSEVSKFKRYIQKVRNGFDLGLFGKGNIAFSKDEELIRMFDDARNIGEDDAPKAFAGALWGLINWMHKAEKWVTIYDNPLYSQRFLQMAASITADLELIRNRENPTRESILRALELNPKLMNEVYVIPSTTVMTADDVRRTIQILDDYIMEHMEWWSRHILRFLSDGEVKTASHIINQCGYAPLFYLVEKGIIQETTEPSRLFKKSNLTVDEAAYFYIKEDF